MGWIGFRSSGVQAVESHENSVSRFLLSYFRISAFQALSCLANYRPCESHRMVSKIFDFMLCGLVLARFCVYDKTFITSASKIYRTSIDTLSKFYRSSIEDISKSHRNSIEHLKFYWNSIEVLLKFY